MFECGRWSRWWFQEPSTLFTTSIPGNFAVISVKLFFKICIHSLTDSNTLLLHQFFCTILHPYCSSLSHCLVQCTNQSSWVLLFVVIKVDFPFHQNSVVVNYCFMMLNLAKQFWQPHYSEQKPQTTPADMLTSDGLVRQFKFNYLFYGFFSLENG